MYEDYEDAVAAHRKGDYVTAFQLYLTLAEKGHARAQNQLGLAHEHGLGTRKNLLEAVRWYRLAAAQNYPDAQKNLARVTSLRPSPQERSGKTAFGAPGETKKSSGSGFFVSAHGHLITNNHVIDGCKTLKATEANGSIVSVRVVKQSKTDDLALLQAQMKPVSFASFRDSARISQGETVSAYGYPLSGLLASSGNVSTGLITAVAGLRDNERQIQISAPVQQGNSGGPLVDSFGAVIGVVVSKLNALVVAKLTDDIPQNINFAIKASAVINLLDASGVDYTTSKSAQQLPIIEITKQMKSYTVRIDCN